MVTCAVFLRLNSLLKLAVLLLAVAFYTYLIHLAFFALTRADVPHRSVARVCSHVQILSYQDNQMCLKQELYLWHTLTTCRCCSLIRPSPLSPSYCSHRPQYIRRKGISIVVISMFIVAIFYNGRQVCLTRGLL